MYYNEQYGTIWERIVKSFQWPVHVHIILTATRSISFGLESPTSFNSLPKIERHQLLLNDAESREMLTLVAPVGLKTELRHHNLMNAMVLSCNGLVGALRICISTLNQNFRTAPDKSENALLRYFFSVDLVGHLERCFTVQANAIAVELIPVLVRLLTARENVVAGGDYSYLLRTGILVVNNNVLEYSSPLASRFVTRLLFPHRLNSNVMPDNLASLVRAAVGKMSATALQQSVVDDIDKPKEAVYQHMFMQALHACTPASVLICPELTRVFPDETIQAGTISGELDFYLNSDLRWGIELLVNGSRYGEHMSRFENGGKYVPLQMKDYAVVDLRKGDPTNVQKHEKRITVFFEHNFKSCAILEGTNSTYTVTLNE